MDVVLEVFDQFVLDRLYSQLHPAVLAPQLTYNGNATSYSFADKPMHVYQPSTQYFPIAMQPSQYAYMSAWPRDNIYRQGLSLYMITW